MNECVKNYFLFYPIVAQYECYKLLFSYKLLLSKRLFFCDYKNVLRHGVKTSNIFHKKHNPLFSKNRSLTIPTNIQIILISYGWNWSSGYVSPQNILWIYVKCFIATSVLKFFMCSYQMSYRINVTLNTMPLIEKM